MSSNTTTILDEDNDDPDWIELFNSSNETIQLEGYTISDSSNEWQFPKMSIHAQKHLLIFASGKDRKEAPIQWNTIIDIGDEWRYNIPNSDTPSNWKQNTFDDSTWPQGKSGFGYGDNDDSTIIDNTISLFIRKSFEINSLDDIEQLALHMDYDDAFVAYINGTEIARANITSNGPPKFDQPADNFDHEAQMYQGGAPEFFLIENISQVLQQGENVIAIQIHNHSTGSSDITAIPFLSTGSSSGESSPSPYLQTIKNNLHTNFELNADGETLLLFNASDELIDSLTFKSIATDISFGRKPDGSNDWAYFSTPTPSLPNNTDGFSSQSSEVSFSKLGGAYTTEQEIKLTSSGTQDNIYYTTDGSLPTTSGTIYDGNPISLAITTCLRAQVINEDALPGPITTQTFLIKSNHKLPVVSLTTQPDNLWDYEEGIYVLGPNAESNLPYFGANFWMDWEKPVHFELINTQGELALAQNVGIKIFGAWSRANNQKSFAIHARKSYGDKTLSYAFFENLDMDQFSSIVLRNSGNDWNNTMFRDAFLTSLFHPEVDKQAYQPAVVYINGEYWGIQNIREKVNEDFLAAHHNLNPDDIIILEADAIPVEGEEAEYVKLIEYVNSHSLSENQYYEYVASKIDISNFIQYQIGNIFIANTDWPGNNIKYWKSTAPESKWRWIAYDTDFGFGIWGESPNHNTLNFALESNGPGWPNPPWSTLLLRKLIQNEDFKQQFVNAFADQLNTTWQSNNITNIINEISSGIEPEIGNHMNRWGGSSNNWRNQVNNLKTYASARPGYVYSHLTTRFNLGSQTTLIINANSSEGLVKLNTLKLNTFPWSGTYFSQMPVELEAIPQAGYRFLRWEGDFASTESVIEISLSSTTELTAVFERANELNAIVINEINYNPPKEFDTEDWIELFNKSSKAVDLTGWILKDDDNEHSFSLPSISIASQEYLIVCRDKVKFESFHQDVPAVGDLDFGLSGDVDCVRLYNNAGELADETCYLAEAPWPKAGNGYTLALKHPSMDNSQADSWYLLEENGNPGERNVLEGSFQLKVPIDEDIIIFPNPVHSDLISFTLSNPIRNANIFLIDLNGGKLDLSNTLTSENDLMTVQLPSELANGFYLLQIELNNDTKVARVFISR